MNKHQVFILENTRCLLQPNDSLIPVPADLLATLVSFQNATFAAERHSLLMACNISNIDFSPFAKAYAQLKQARENKLISSLYWQLPVFAARDLENIRAKMASPDTSFDNTISQMDEILSAASQPSSPAGIYSLLRGLDQYTLSFLSTATWVYFSSLELSNNPEHSGRGWASTIESATP